MFARTAICSILLFFAGAALADEAKNRVALVIGNAAYSRAALANPVNDAKLMAERLKAQGFEVFAAYDAGRRDMKLALQSYAASLREHGKDVAAFIFYSGHGMQVKGENYLIPVDEHIENEADVDIDAVSLSSITSMLDNTQTRLAIVVLDACRANPFAFSRGAQRGFAPVPVVRSGTLIAFSTAPGMEAPDGPAGENSFYAAALAQALGEPGLKIEDVFKKVRIAVYARTHGAQTPWEHSSLLGDFYPAGQAPAAEGHESLVSKKAPRLPQVELGAAKPVPSPLPPAITDEKKSQQQVAAAPVKPQPAIAAAPAGTPDARPPQAAAGVKPAPEAPKPEKPKEKKVAALKPAGAPPVPAPPAIQYEDASQRLIRTLSGHTDTVASVAITADGRYGLSGSNDGTVRRWDLASGHELRTFKLGTAGLIPHMISVALTPDGRYGLSGENFDGTMTLWDLSTGEAMRTIKTGSTNKGTISVALSADGHYGLSANNGEGVKFWDLLAGKELLSIKRRRGNQWPAVAMTPDGRYGLTSANDGTLTFWNFQTRQEIHTLWAGSFSFFQPNFRSVTINPVALTPEGRVGLSGDDDDSTILKLWDLSSGRELRTLKGHVSPVLSAAISNDGRYALSGSCADAVTAAICSKGSLKLWSVPTGQELHEFTGHASTVMSVAISADGRLALTGSRDDTMKLWDVSEWTQPQEARR